MLLLLLIQICLHVHENEIYLTSKLLHVLSVLVQCSSGLASRHLALEAIDFYASVGRATRGIR